MTPEKCEKAPIISPDFSSSVSNSPYTSTQEAFDVVKKNFVSLRESLLVPPSVNHQAIMQIGKEVTHLTNEVKYLRQQLQIKSRHCDALKIRLSRHEQREEQQLIKDRIDHERHSEMRKRYQDYHKYAPRNFS